MDQQGQRTACNLEIRARLQDNTVHSPSDSGIIRMYVHRVIRLFGGTGLAGNKKLTGW